MTTTHTPATLLLTRETLDAMANEVVNGWQLSDQEQLLLIDAARAYLVFRDGLRPASETQTELHQTQTELAHTRMDLATARVQLEEWQQWVAAAKPELDRVCLFAHAHGQPYAGPSMPVKP